jgi:hypothetical protein
MILGGLAAAADTEPSAAEMAQARSEHPSMAGIDEARRQRFEFDQEQLYAHEQLYAWWDTWSS